MVLALFLALAVWGLFIKPQDPTDSSISDLTWEEDVTLASGETVRFKRRMKIEQDYSWGIQSMGPKIVREATLEPVTPNGSFVPWSAPIMPFYIDRDPENGEWVVIGASDQPSFDKANGDPCPTQWAFRLRKGVWYIQPVPKSFLGNLPNLLADVRVEDDAMYSDAEWGTIVVQRKVSQIPERGFRLTPTARSVGEISFDPQCKGKDPQFTRDFVVQKDMEPASLAEFPRLP